MYKRGVQAQARRVNLRMKNFLVVRAYIMNTFSKIVILAAVVQQAAPVTPANAMQSDVWGQWYSTQCRPVRINSPLGGNGIEQPQIAVPGRERTQECKWERRKQECPKVTNRITKPMKCLNRFQNSGWAIKPPSN